MAIAKNGIFGHQNGRIGNVVFYTLNGQNVSRMIGRYVDKPTDPQLYNRNTMSVTMELLKPLQEMVRSGFEVQARGTVRNAYNLAVSHNKKFALKDVGKEIKVNYAKVKLSDGVLPTSEKTSITKVKGGVQVDWEISTGNKAYGSDMVMIALYYPGSKGASVHLNQAKRADGKVFVPVSKKRHNESVEVYMFFKSVDGERVSDTVYLGNMNGKAMTPEEHAEYVIAVAALDKARTSFAKERTKFAETSKKTKNYRNLEKECHIWEVRILNLSGSPG